MIVVRNIFHLHFGKAKEGIPLLKEGAALMARGHPRVLADVTGDFYTLVLELTYASMSEAEADPGDPEAMAAWSKIYERFVPLVHSGKREVFRIIE